MRLKLQWKRSKFILIHFGLFTTYDSNSYIALNIIIGRLEIAEEEKQKVLKDMEACRIEALKQVAKSKEGFAETMREMRRRYESERERKISDHEAEVKSLTREVTEKSSKASDLEASLEKKAAQVDSLALKMKKMQEQSEANESKLNQKFELLLKEKSSEIESLEASIYKQSSKVDSLTTQLKELQEEHKV